ncbi:hypothetical protein [Devosia soli]|uniref:hypothetical protein n=1 Tax=Devosia soli TaxID=361041 RepID=UPI000B11EF6E
MAGAVRTSRGRSDDLSRGTTQSSARPYNERLVLSLVRRHASLPKADIARLPGLYPPTISLTAYPPYDACPFAASPFRRFPVV